MNITLDNQKVLTTGALVLSVIILLAAFGLALWPLPSTADQIKVLKNKSTQAIDAGKKARESAQAQQAKALTETWAGTGNEIGPTAYENINQIASALNVKIEGFRAQRAVDAGDVTQLPYVLNATGTFVNVLSFVHKIESTPTKLAVETFQLGSADESSDQVTATIGLEAYVLNATTTISTTTTTTTTKGTSKTISGTTLAAPAKASSSLSPTETTSGRTNPVRTDAGKAEFGGTGTEKVITTVKTQEVKNGKR